jgi:hypothetical protein
MRVATVLAVLLAAGGAGLAGCAQLGTGRTAAATAENDNRPLTLTELLVGRAEAPETPSAEAPQHPAAVMPPPPDGLMPPDGAQISAAEVPTKEDLLAQLKSRPDVDPAELARWERIIQISPETDWPLVAIQLQAVLNYKDFQAKQEAAEAARAAAAKAAEAQQPETKQPIKAQPASAASPDEAPAPSAGSTQDSEKSKEKPPTDGAASAESETKPDVLPPPSKDDSPRPLETAATGSEPAGEAPPPGAWRAHLEKAIEALEAELHGSIPDEPAAVGAASSIEDDSLLAPSERKRANQQAHLRLLYLVAQRRADAARGVEQLPPAEREFWKHQVHGLGVYLDEQGAPVPDRRARLALRELREGLHHLAAASGLDVRSLAFCPQVFGFGNYVEFTPYEFRAGQEILLYAEIDNFMVETRPDGFETELQGSYQIFDAAGRRVAEHVFSPEKELCRNRRRDYFVPYRIYLPKRIDPGPYTLQLTVEDLKGQKFGQAPIRFTIVP